MVRMHKAWDKIPFMFHQSIGTYGKCLLQKWVRLQICESQYSTQLVTMDLPRLLGAPRDAICQPNSSTVTYQLVALLAF